MIHELEIDKSLTQLISLNSFSFNIPVSNMISASRAKASKNSENVCNRNLFLESSSIYIIKE